MLVGGYTSHSLGKAWFSRNTRLGLQALVQDSDHHELKGDACHYYCKCKTHPAEAPFKWIYERDNVVNSIEGPEQ